jgi:hypothetical protein
MKLLQKIAVTLLFRGICGSISMCTSPVHMSSGQSEIFHVDAEEVQSCLLFEMVI